ncbi:MAG: MFS transporter [Xanthobacteraceae bacterium]|nr:MFS transporter [Xanthobacteraceae bacterium]
MTAITTADFSPHHQEGISPRLTFLLALTCGLVVANLYYAQPLIGPISEALGLPLDVAGLIVTMTQIGYVLGLLLIVPLADLVENRRLICVVIGIGAVALLGAALSSRPLPFLAAALVIGIGSVSVQIVVPFAAHLAPEASRGRVVGNVTTGLLLGIMLARPVASFVTAAASWHTIFFCSTGVMVVLALVLSQVLPRRVPAARLGYGALLRSMLHLARTTPVLRRRAAYQAALFAAFSLFWTVTPLLLAGPAFGLSQRGIALFALAGVAGAVAAPIAGRLADRGHSRFATASAMLIVAASFLISHVGAAGSPLALAALVIAGIVLDFGVQANLVVGFRAIFALAPEARGRLNGLYLASFFAAGAAGSAIGGWAFVRGGWPLASWIGFALPVAALVYFVTE